MKQSAAMWPSRAISPRLHKPKRPIKVPEIPRAGVNAPIVRSGHDCWAVRLKRSLQAS